MRIRTAYWGALCALVCLLATGSLASAATISVAAGGDLQKALDAAKPGDTITLEPGATYVGNFVLRNKGAVTDFITIRSAAPDAALPVPGVRLTPKYAAQLPKIRSSNSMSALRTATGANHYKLLFLEFQGNVGGFGDIIAFGAGDSTQTMLSDVPYALVIDRTYVHGDPVFGQKRGISLHSSDTQVLNSYVSECMAVGQDAQAISGFNGPGNYLIENNYLEGSTENFLLGGADPTIPNLVTTNVTFRHNHLFKPLSWRDPIMPTPTGVSAKAAPGAGSLAAGTYAYRVASRRKSYQNNPATSASSTEVSATIAATGGVTISWTPVAGAEEYLVYGRTPGGQTMYWKTTQAFLTDTGAAGTATNTGVERPTYGGTKWAVKNIFELKNAQDVLVEGNVFDNLWVADQPGYPIVFTPRNQSKTAPWVVVQRVDFRYNLTRHTAGGVNILGVDNLAPSQRTNHVTVRNNVFEDMTSATWGSGSRPFMVGDGAEDVTIDHNTVITTDSTILWFYGGSATAPTTNPRLKYTNNMSVHNTYGVFGSNFSTGLSTINAYMPDGTFTGNVLAGGKASLYPAGNYFPTVAAWQAQFADYAGGDYQLKPNVYACGAIGCEPGADIPTVRQHAAIAVAGDNRGTTPVVIITSSPLASGTLNEALTRQLECTVGNDPCAWRLMAGSLPNGLMFDETLGLVTGTPTEMRTATFTVDAYDPANQSNSVSADFDLTIEPAAFKLTMAAAPAGQVGVGYTVAAAITGAVGAVSCSVVDGSLPDGLTLSPLCDAVSGVPSHWGTFAATVQAQDSLGRTDRAPISVFVAPAHLVIDPSPLARATYGAPYSALFSATGGTGSTTWSLTSANSTGLTLDAGGALSGTPAAPGDFALTVQAKDANYLENVASETFSLKVDAPAFSIELPALPAVNEGDAFSVAATATGNVGTVAWTLASGTLPAGVTLDANGVISGVPARWGTYTVAVQGTDSWGTNRVDSKPLSIVVAPTTLSISTAALAPGTYQAAYATTLTAVGGTGSVTWSVTAGRLPNGVTLNAASGVLSGTPTEVGTFDVVVRASDGNWEGDSATRPLALVVQPTTFTASIASAAAGRVATPLTIPATASGQMGTVVWSLSGSLPAGVNFDAATGTIAGVPTSFGEFNPVVRAQDSWAASRFVQATVTIRIAPAALAVTTDAVAAGSLGRAYTATFTAIGGTGLTTWRVSAGSLPAGVALGANGVLAGTPAEAGSFAFTAEAADAGWPDNVATKQLKLAVGVREIVLRAADATRVSGAWSVIADPTAAGGSRLSNPDVSAAKLTAALANPVNYFELTFQAEAGVAYHLWLRGKAANNYWGNDSVYVQFSGSVDANGAAINRIGTSGAAAVSIEDGSNAGLSGWGWADDSYGGFAGPMYFATGGAQTIRIQVREDGLSLDQIVLSAGKYATRAPGATKNDTTIATTDAPAALSINAATLANATYRIAYAGSLTASGGTGSTIWSVVSGQLPPGIALGANGALAGTPTALGDFTFTVQARDANYAENVATAPVTLTVVPPVYGINPPAALPAAIVGQAYTATFTAVGNIGNVAWSIASGTLPAGLTLDVVSGTIGGVPSTWGVSPVVVRGTDSIGRADDEALTITVAPTPVVINTPVLADAMFKTAYQAAFTAGGGTGATAWSLASGRLPNGIALNAATGALSGTPLEAGTFAFTVRVVDANWEGDADSKSATLIVHAPAFTAQIPSAAAGRIGQQLQVASTASGAVGSVVWSLVSGSLPGGVAFDAATGIVAGVPTAAGTFSVVIRAQDSWDASRSVDGTLALRVAPTSLAVTTTTLAAANISRAYNATLTATGGTGSTTWRVSAGSLPAGVVLGVNGALSGTPTVAGSFTFTAEATDAGWTENVATKELKLSVASRDIVLYATEATRVAGAWSLVADPSAAGGARMSNPDANAVKLAAALAGPANYFELTFQAEAGVAYHLWLRGKAVNNYWGNDSVYVQFSGSVDANGGAINRIGTSGAAAVSIEDGSNAGLSGWGWADDSYGGFASPMYFATSGAQTIRIQVREDGVSLDQIVLSADRFAAAAPGAAKNDATVLSK